MKNRIVKVMLVATVLVACGSMEAAQLAAARQAAARQAAAKQAAAKQAAARSMPAPARPRAYAQTSRTIPRPMPGVEILKQPRVYAASPAKQAAYKAPTNLQRLNDPRLARSAVPNAPKQTAPTLNLGAPLQPLGKQPMQWMVKMDAEADNEVIIDKDYLIDEDEVAEDFDLNDVE